MIQFNSKLHLAVSRDDLRPAMAHIYFDHVYVYATDGHIIIRESLSKLGFEPEDIEMVRGKFLTPEAYKMLYNSMVFKAEKNGFLASVKGIGFMTIPYAEVDYRYPDAEKLLQQNFKKEPKPISYIGINNGVLTRITKCIGWEYTSLRLDFYGENEMVLVRPTEDAKSYDLIAGIMPVLISHL